jgi:hypothetical protein
MSYRDDVDALFTRATSLQREVDRLKAELAARPEPGPAPAPPEIPSPPPGRRPPSDTFQWRPSTIPTFDEIAVPTHMRERGRQVWLPPAPPPPPPTPTAPPPRELRGLLVARLTPTEHDVVQRLLNLLSEDDFSPSAVERNVRALERLVEELRVHLAADV